nr:MAG TPA: Neck appendage protein [Caudoviricetes sp.]
MDALTRRQFDRAMFAKERTLAIRVGNYTSRDIKEASFEYGYIKGDTYKPGGTCAGSGKITFTSIITTFNKLDILHPEIGLLVGNTYQWVKMGEYFINDIEIDRNRNTTTLELMDGMFKLNREYVTDLHFPAEVREVIQEICLKTGIELANDFFGISAMRYHVEQVPEGKKLSFRDMLSSMTQMIGMSCFFNREGKMEIRDLTESNITINADSYFLHGLTKSEIEYQIAGITCKTDKKPLTVGMKTGRSLELDNVFMTQSALNDLYYKLKNLTYYPYNLNYQGHLLLEVGQWVTIQTNKKETFKVPVLSQSFTFKGGLRGRISADSKAGNDTQYSYEGTITKQIKQQDGIEAKIQAQIEAADAAFDAEFKKRKKEIDDGIELAKAKAEEVKQELSDTIDQRFNSFNNGPLQEAKRRAEEALRNAGASTLLAQEAKRIGLESVSKLEEFKRHATSAQAALSGDLDALKRTVASEVNQASEYRRTTTEALSRMTGQMNGFATKSEVKQDIDGLTQTFAKMKVGGRNYAEDYDFSRSLWQYSQGDSSPQDWTILNGEYNVKGTTNTWKQMQIYSKEGSRTSSKSSTALLDLEIGETYTLSFQGICYSGSPNVWVSLRANRTAPGNPEIMNGNFTLTSSWQTYQVTIPALTKPDNFDFWRIILGYSEIGHVAFRKVELTRSSTRIDAGPALEDGKTDLVVAKSEFQKTADGLSAKLATVENYVGQDDQRQEALRKYTREESAKQATSVRELVTRDYVGKSAYQEDVRGIERRLEAITNPQNGSIATQIAKYKTVVDGRFADITSMISGKANQTDFQRVRETSQLYERILGNTENGIADKVARMALTSQLFQVEVSKASASGRNLFLNSLFKRDLRDKYSTYKLFDDTSQTKGQLAVSIDSDNQFRGVNTLKIVSTFNGKTDNQKITFSLGGNSRTGRVDELKNKSARFSFWAKSTVNNTNFQARAGYRGAVKSVSLTTDWQFYDVEFIRNENTNATSELILHVFSNATVWIAFPKVEIGTVSTPFSEAPEDTDEAIRSVQTQLAGSWAVQNLTSAGALVSGLNLGANGHNRLDGKLTHITGETLIDKAVIKSAMIDKLNTANFESGSVTTAILDAEAVTAEKVRFDDAFIRKMIANEAFINQLTSKRIFATKIESVVSSSTFLEAYQGRIGGFTLGQFDQGGGRWISGVNQFSVGMGNGAGYGVRTAFWANWGNNWNYAGPKAWNVNTDGKMYCRNEVSFYDRVDFSNASRANFYGTTTFSRSPVFSNGIELGSKDVFGDGSNPKGGRNAVVWWNQVDSGSVKYWMEQKSDRRLKENITDTAVKALDKINRLRMVAFDFVESKKHEEIGLIAQEAETIVPRIVSRDPENPDGYLHIDYTALVPYLIKAIQELNQKIEKMEKTIA